MKPLVSEFSHGYALTQELVAGRLGPLRGAPIFPSLIEEGWTGGDTTLGSRLCSSFNEVMTTKAKSISQDVYGSDFPGETFRVLKEKAVPPARHIPHPPPGAGSMAAVKLNGR